MDQTPQMSDFKIVFHQKEEEESQNQQELDPNISPLRMYSYKLEKIASTGNIHHIGINPLVQGEDNLSVQPSLRKIQNSSRYHDLQIPKSKRNYLPPISKQMQSEKVIPIELPKQKKQKKHNNILHPKLEKEKESFVELIQSYPKNTLQVIKVLPRDPKFIFQPIISGFILQGTVNRIRLNSKQAHNRYQYVVSASKQQMMMAEPQTCIMSSKYLIKSSSDVIGTLLSNYAGSRFQLILAGQKQPSCIIQYKSNFCGNSTREFKVLIPKEKLTLQNKPAIYNPKTNKFNLSFDRRAEMSSLKNFILVQPPEYEQNVILMGKMKRDQFSLDVTSSVSPIEAFAIAISSFDPKFICE